jgi:Tol biopolymer transport system component
MVACWRFAVSWFLGSIITFVAPSCNRADEPAERLPSQTHNRMVYVRTGTDSELFVNMPGHYDLGSPSISPQGKSIAFDALTIGKAPRRETWLVDVDGKNLRKLADGGTARWSPDGKRLLISRSVSATSSVQRQIYEFEIAKGSNDKGKLIRDGRYPDWSPDGKRIVFAAEGSRTGNSGVHPGSKLWTANADGTDAVALCDGNWPSWSPDGKKIAYGVQTLDKPAEMWTIELDTKKQTKVGLGFYRAQWLKDSKSFACNGIFRTQGETGFSIAPATFFLDKPLQPRYFATELDNPFSPCFSRDGRSLVLIVDSQKRRGENNR